MAIEITIEPMKQQILFHVRQALQEDNAEIQRQAVEALRYIGCSQEELKLLAQLLNPNVDRSIRFAAIEALGAIGGDEALEVLLSVPRDGDPVVRWKADEVLDKLLSRGKVQDMLPLPPLDEDELVTIIS